MGQDDVSLGALLGLALDLHTKELRFVGVADWLLIAVEVKWQTLLMAQEEAAPIHVEQV